MCVYVCVCVCVCIYIYIYIYIYSRKVLNCKKEQNNNISSNMDAWMGLKIIMLNEESQRNTNIIWYYLYVETKIWYKWTYLQTETDSQTQKQIYGYQRKKEWG